jgi:murein DD-endopeptidase MepM/ murein hydrolase activator NlpD
MQLKRKKVCLIAAVLAVVPLFMANPPQTGGLVYAETQSNLQQQINQLQQDLQASKQRVHQIETLIQSMQQQKTGLLDEIDKLDAEISKINADLQVLGTKIQAKTAEVSRTQAQLAELEQKVAQQNEVLKERIKLMYEQSNLKYLDVLLSSTSFSDFLDRVALLQMIAKQDKRILEEVRKNRDAVRQLKAELDKQLEQLQLMKTAEENQKLAISKAQAAKKTKLLSIEANVREEQKLKEEEIAKQQEFIDKIFAMQTKISTYTGSGVFAWPVPGHMMISSDFGLRTDPFTGKEAGHNGIDIPAPEGTPIVAAESGTVITAGQVTGFGNCIILDHGSNIWTLYGHIMDGGILVSNGQKVEKGQQIARVGSTGRSTGPHLHFGVYKDGKPINPHTYLK